MAVAGLQVWSCVDTNNVDGGNPWGCHVVITMGYLVALAITVPMGVYNLDDNMIVQVDAVSSQDRLSAACPDPPSAACRWWPLP
jgi:hypothetical protein